MNLKANRVLRSILFHLLRRHHTSRRLPGASGRLWFPAGKHLNLFFNRTALIEPEVTANLRRLVGEEDVVFDIGANIGYYTLLCSRWAPRGRVVAVEPDPDNLVVLRENVARNGLSNVVVVGEALSRQGGVARLFQDRNTGRTSSLEEDAWHTSGPLSIEVRPVETATIDMLAARHGVPSVIKCDVEGHEVAVLEGASEVLARHPIIVLEVQAPNRERVSEILRRHGYSFYDAEARLSRTSTPLASLSALNVIALTDDAFNRFPA